ncbi:MAG: thiamine-phosphate kinase [Opitutales bacterium]|nr:thiamine-phosphate kinase [Opitutales bacterium]
MNPFTDNTAESVASIGETALIERVREWLGPCVPPSPEGMGDDCAVTEPKANLITCDSLIYGKHFDKDCLPELAGEKLLKRNVSDIAAMGGLPANAVVAMFLPATTSLAWVEGFCKGLSRAAERFSARIVGGDIAESEAPFIAATLTLTGRARKPLLRGTAKAGDVLFVSGPLGCSIDGHHLTFEPRVEQGMFLSFLPEVSSCMDLSDGLGKDLPSLCGAKLAASLNIDELPPSAETLANADGDPEAILRHILCDGEDYELAFTVSAEAADSFEESWNDRFGAPPFRIGTIVARDGDGPQLLDAATGKALEYKGYEHLRQA